MLTPSSALEANYGITYQNTIHYLVSTQLYVQEFNPFVEGGPAGLIFLPIRNSGTGSLDVKQQTAVAGMYGAGIAYEISPSFDIRAEYRGICDQGADFGGDSQFDTKRWYNISTPAIGVAYHF